MSTWWHLGHAAREGSTHVRLQDQGPVAVCPKRPWPWSRLARREKLSGRQVSNVDGRAKTRTQAVVSRLCHQTCCCITTSRHSKRRSYEASDAKRLGTSLRPSRTPYLCLVHFLGRIAANKPARSNALASPSVNPTQSCSSAMPRCLSSCLRHLVALFLPLLQPYFMQRSIGRLFLRQVPGTSTYAPARQGQFFFSSMPWTISTFSLQLIQEKGYSSTSPPSTPKTPAMVALGMFMQKRYLWYVGYREPQVLGT